MLATAVRYRKLRSGLQVSIRQPCSQAHSLQSSSTGRRVSCLPSSRQALLRHSETESHVDGLTVHEAHNSVVLIRRHLVYVSYWFYGKDGLSQNPSTRRSSTLTIKPTCRKIVSLAELAAPSQFMACCSRIVISGPSTTGPDMGRY